MLQIQFLIDLADAYKAATGITKDTTVSYRVFGDSKKLASLRSGGDITTTRFNDAIAWFSANWPIGARPKGLRANPNSSDAA